MSALRQLLSPYRTGAGRRVAGLAVVAALVLVAAVIVVHDDRRLALDHRLLALPPDAVTARAELLRTAAAEARPLYAAHCAGCHGTDLRGRVATGAPNLVDAHWLYGTGRVSEIERTILFGIRSGRGKARNVAEMPAFGQTGLLQPAEIHEVVSYILGLSHRREAADAVAAGRAIYVGKGGCADCHGGDARGNPDYGAPDLTADTWANGGDRQDLTNSIFYGRHGICPGWYGILGLGQIRALAVYIHAAATAGPAA